MFKNIAIIENKRYIFGWFSVHPMTGIKHFPW
jgi:hypothetical protein